MRGWLAQGFRLDAQSREGITAGNEYRAVFGGHMLKKVFFIVTGCFVVALCGILLWGQSETARLFRDFPQIDAETKREIRISLSDRNTYRRAVQLATTEAEPNWLQISKDLQHVSVFEKNGTFYLDRINAGHTRAIIYESGGTLLKCVLQGKTVYVNRSNDNVTATPVAQAAKTPTYRQEEIKWLDPFSNNAFRILPYGPTEKNYEIIEMEMLREAGYEAKQKLTVYESQTHFKTLEKKGLLLQRGTPLPVIAFMQKVGIETVAKWCEEAGLLLDAQGCITEDALFCTYQRLTYDTGRYLTLCNPMPPYNGQEVLLYQVCDPCEIEMQYQTPYLLNGEGDILSIKYLQKPEQAALCDRYYQSIALQTFAQTLSRQGTFTLWEAPAA